MLSDNRIPTTHVGSLIRPPELLRYITAIEQGVVVDRAAFKPRDEHPELVAQRLVRLARLVGRDNLLAGTDCGFAQATQVRRVHPSIQWAKLEALSAGARLASRELWSGA